MISTCLANCTPLSILCMCPLLSCSELLELASCPRILPPTPPPPENFLTPSPTDLLHRNSVLATRNFLIVLWLLSLALRSPPLLLRPNCVENSSPTWWRRLGLNCKTFPYHNSITSLIYIGEVQLLKTTRSLYIQLCTSSTSSRKNWQLDAEMSILRFLHQAP